MNADTLNHIIKSRRAIYPATYTGEIVDDKHILQILENANWAPNHKKTEPWRFKVLTKSNLPKLSEYLADYYKNHTPEDKFSQTKYDRTLHKMDNCSHVIAICMARDPEHSVPEWEEIAAVSCAVQNMWLTCYTLQIGCYWSTPKAALEANQLLGLKDNERCLGLFYIGIPKPIAMTVPGVRRPIEEKVEWLTL